MQRKQHIAIVGSGLVGALQAIYLRRRGHDVQVYDRRPDIRKVEFSGRSINLAVSTRGWVALDKVGIGDAIRALGIPMEKRAMHVVGKSIYYQYYGRKGEVIHSISRGLLNRKMVDLAEEEGVKFQFDSKVWEVDLTRPSLFLGESELEPKTEVKFDRIIAADGAFSRVRYKMQRRSLFNYSQEFLPVGYKELSIPAGPEGSHLLEKHSLHIWPRGSFMLIALPNLDGSFTVTLFLPFEGSDSFASLSSEKEVLRFFKAYFPDALTVMPTLVEDFQRNPLSSLVTTKCYPWTYWDKVALVGDAAHAIVPFYGQGMNAGFEDVVELDKLMGEYGDDWELIFSEYQKNRKPNADAIAELSYRNFIEMSEKTADKLFLLRKQIEKHFSDKHPDLWVPLYNQVTFSIKPYSQALLEGDRQEQIMDLIMAMPDIESRWQSAEVEDRILSLLKNQVSLLPY